MILAAEAPIWLAAIFALLLLIAAIEDAVRLRISNIITICILIGAFVAAILAGPESSLWQNFVVFGGLLVVGTPLFAAGKLGGGDVKLLAASGLWFDLKSALPMLIYVLLAGGVLALIILILRFFGWSDNARARIHLLKKGGGIPYGVAIAAGVIVAVAMLRA